MRDWGVGSELLSFRARARNLGSWGGQVPLRQSEPDAGAALLGALDPDAAAVRLDDPLRDRQPQPGAAGGPRPRFLAAVEALEDPRQIGGGDPLARVGDLDQNPVLSFKF